MKPQLNISSLSRTPIEDGKLDTIPLQMKNAYPYPIPQEMYKGGPAIPL